MQIEKQMEERIDNLTKPIGALGELENLVIRLSGIQETLNLRLEKKVVIVMCADNGVVAEGVSECPQEVTATVTTNFTKGITAINNFCKYVGADIHIVDVGVKGRIEHPDVTTYVIREGGTANFIKEPAMTKEQALKAIWAGIEETEKYVKRGYEIFGTGEMGIGNTTTSAAVLSVLLERKPEEVVGKGAGARTGTLQNKISVIEKAISIHQPNKEDVIDVLAKVGGLDIAALCGVFLAAAKNKKAVVIDGFISAVAALCAYKLMPKSKAYMFVSHASSEMGMQYILEELGFVPPLQLGMRLGEGTGCPLLFQLIDTANYVLTHMGTFEDAQVEKCNYLNIWK